MRMRLTSLSLWALAFASMLGIAPHAVAAEDATDVIKKAIDAHGGLEALKKATAMQTTIKGDMNLSGIELKFDGTIYSMLPDKYRMEITATGAGDMKFSLVQVVNGKKISLQMNQKELPVDKDTKTQLEQASIMMEVSVLYPLIEDKKFTLKKLDDARVEDEECSVIQLSGGSLKDAKLYFNKKSGLMVKVDRKSNVPGVGEVDEVSVISAFKKFNGVLIGTSIKVTQDKKPFMTMNVTDVTISDKIDEKKFTLDQ